MSTYVGYLAHIINHMFGVPFGAGQLAAGLHIYWLILIFIIVRKSGTPTLAGIIKGFVELFTGGSHGIIIVLISLIQGLILDLALPIDRFRTFKPTVALAAGVSSCSNVIIFQMIYFSSNGKFVVPIEFILAMSILSFSSGMILGGFFALETFKILNESMVIPQLFRGIQYEISNHTNVNGASSNSIRSKMFNPSSIATLFLILILGIGAVGYFALVYEAPFRDLYACDINGEVNNPFTYHHGDFQQHETTIEGELEGLVTYEKPRNYTGVPIHIIISQANPKINAKTLRIIASDGYYMNFDLTSVMSDEELILIKDNGLRVIAANYDGAYWIRSVVEFIIS